MKKETLLEILDPKYTKKLALLCILIVVLLSVAQGYHTAHVFRSIEEGSIIVTTTIAILFTLGFESAIVIATVAGQQRWARAFFLFQIAINYLHYAMSYGMSWKFGKASFLSLLIPLSILFFTELMSKLARIHHEMTQKVEEKPRKNMSIHQKLFYN